MMMTMIMMMMMTIIRDYRAKSFTFEVTCARANPFPSADLRTRHNFPAIDVRIYVKSRSFAITKSCIRNAHLYVIAMITINRIEVKGSRDRQSLRLARRKLGTVGARSARHREAQEMKYISDLAVISASAQTPSRWMESAYRDRDLRQMDILKRRKREGERTYSMNGPARVTIAKKIKGCHLLAKVFKLAFYKRVSPLPSLSLSLSRSRDSRVLLAR